MSKYDELPRTYDMFMDTFNIDMDNNPWDSATFDPKPEDSNALEVAQELACKLAGRIAVLEQEVTRLEQELKACARELRLAEHRIDQLTWTPS